MRSFGIVVAVVFLVVFSVPAAGQTPECQTSASPTKPQLDRRSEPQPRAAEILLGSKAAAEYESTIKLFCDDTVHAYVDRITQTVVRGSNVRVPIRVKIVDSSEVNALSFPGGFLYINTGLVLAATNEAEIAGVVAHEIAHVVARDGMRAQEVGQHPGINTGVTPSPDGATGVGQIDGYLVGLSNIGARRESEADFNGIRYLQKAGYSPRAMITFLERMLSKEQTDPSVLRMFQIHPPTRERIRRIGERIGYPPAVQNAVADAELQTIKQIVTDRSGPPPVPSTSH
jgi:beta-barrel assembly-enhancing protease